MARYLLAATPIAGHVLPMLGIGADLQRRGHDVCLLTGDQYSDRVRRAGMHLAILPGEAQIPSSASAPPSRLAPTIRRYMRGQAELDSVFIAPLVAQFDAMDAVLRREPVDAVLVDLAFIGALGCLLKAHPRPPILVCGVSPLTLSSAQTPPFGMGWPPQPSVNYTNMNRFVHRVLFARTQNRLNRALRDVGAGRSPVFLTDWPRLADKLLQLTVPGFEYPRADLPANVSFVGPILPNSAGEPGVAPWLDQLGTARTVIHVTQGTWDNTDLDQLIGTTLRALADRQDCFVIATTGGGPIHTLRCPVPTNAFVADYLPYEQLLPNVDVVITNGGYGGVQHALRYGKPVIVAGETADKAEVAARVGYTGTGINLGTAHPTPTDIDTAVDQILTDPNYRIAAHRLSLEIAAATPLDTIANALADISVHPIPRADAE
ncbi:nucleotide disphospho-sugar-binding domain-containing protein [Nocardia salmonicida]|uniref:glycosyltransferase n=1 Tax=Nocardia TaxID=1817 RepID=UPI0026597308|nr:nucleotide disphospho-sugar-binding domain-containing protein [Nocardia sp. PE-7]WKG11744.1 glycosyltransferase [Nocardia sp. PE-7]